MPGIAVTGASGRMGVEILRAAAADPSVRIVAAVSRAGGEGRVPTLKEALARSPDVVIDFTTPGASLAHVAACADAGVPIVIGTTGFAPEGRAAIAEAASRIPAVLAPNTSVGVNVLVSLVAEAARLLGDGFDLEISEAHHRHKKDAPSGTALRLASALAAARGLDAASAVRSAREGPRGPGEIGIAVVRGGDVVGEHTVFFLGDGERLEITHRAGSRAIFARGALRAASWLVGRPPGLYGMEHVLGLGP